MYVGDFKTNQIVHAKFSLNAAAGTRTDPSNPFENADVLIYRDNSTTERSSAAGITLTSSFDGKTGAGHISIDLSDNSDAGFYAVGHDYFAYLYPDETVDSITFGGLIAHWSIQNRNNQVDVRQWIGTTIPEADVAGYPKVTLRDSAIDALFDRANGVEASYTLRQALRLMLSALAGKSSGLDTTTAYYRNMADSANRITATVDSVGNRTAIIHNVS